MRAITQYSLGGPEVLTVAEVERPLPGPTEVLVRVHAAGVNPVDWKIRTNGGFGKQPPFTLGHDVSGVVEALGAGVTIHDVGDEVFGMPFFPGSGAYAEYVTAPARHFARKPAGIDHVHAAALPLAGLTAWQSLAETAGLTRGQRVLVHAAAGGVGHLAVQMAKHLGAHVIGTAREAKHPLLKDLGADEVIDYTQVDFAEMVSDVDVVLDAVGGDYAERSLRTLRDGGRLIQLTQGGATRELRAAAEPRGIRTGYSLVEPDWGGMRTIAGLVESGELRVEIDSVLPLDQVAKAHELSELGRTTGKIVLSVAD